jgi:hypothetical protein
MILDPEDPYRYVSVQGRVLEFTEEDAADHYRDLAMRYTGEEGRYERRYGDEERSRVILAVEVEDLIAVDID